MYAVLVLENIHPLISLLLLTGMVLLARDASLERIVALFHDVRPPVTVCPSGRGVHCDHTMHFNTDLTL